MNDAMIDNISRDLEPILEYFSGKNTDNECRYRSFDYCYDWFQTHKNKVADTDKIDVSCLHLMCYLASWGMLRGSSILLQKSIKFYEPLVRLIAGQKVSSIEGINQKIWEIDVNDYSQENIQIILETYNQIKTLLYGETTTRHIVSVTKIMLGVFGCVPAFDRYFCETFKYFYPSKGFSSDNLTCKQLECISEFYVRFRSIIDNKKIVLVDGNKKFYPNAKIIDMYGFSRSFFYQDEIFKKYKSNDTYQGIIDELKKKGIKRTEQEIKSLMNKENKQDKEPEF